MKIRLAIVTIVSVTASIDAALAKTDEKLLLFPANSSVLCIEEQATGFNWRNKAWTQTNYRPDTKFVARKLDPETYKDSASRRKKREYLFCDDPKIDDFGEKGGEFSGFVQACYEIKNMGEEATFLSARQCTEFWKEGRLNQISCGDHYSPTYFHPDGAYIRYPWHSNIEKDADKKDSLILSVGSCSKIN